MKNIILPALLFLTLHLNAQCFNKVSAGNDYVISLLNNGTMWSWGRNEFGQLGLGNNIPQYFPSKVGLDTDWIFVEAGESSTFAIKSNGTLWSWGRNEFGQLGHGNMTNVWVPTQVGTDNDWKFVSNHSNHTIALKNDNTLWGWGKEGGSSPGETGLIDSTTPTQIGTDTWRMISAGQFRAAAIKSDGTLWSWGDAMIGNGTTGRVTTITQIGTDNQWKSVSCSGSHTMAIKQDGSLWGWGENYYGTIGNGTVDNQLSPVRIGNVNDWGSVEAGIGSTHAVKTDGSLWGWGMNGWGEIGDGTTINKLIPTRVGTDNNWESISSSGFRYTMGLRSDDTLWGWGMNLGGAPTGNGTNTENHIPTIIDCTALNTQSHLQAVFSYYPNPVKDYLFFESTRDADKAEVYDISGRILLASQITEGSINLSSLQAGNYILKIYIKNEVFNTKIVKE